VSPAFIVRAFTTTVLTVAAVVAPFEQIHAHPIDMAVASVTLTERGGEGTLSLGLRANSAEIPAHIREGSSALATILLGEFTFEQTPSRCVPDMTGEQITGANIRVSFSLRCSAGAHGTTLLIQRDPLLLGDFPPDFTTVFIMSREGRSLSATMGRDESRRRVDFPSTTGFVESLVLGMAHIGATPSEWFRDGQPRIPEGIDHILFVMTLVLASSSLLSLFKTVTGFTVGHSLSLAYMTLAGRSIQPALVEPAIAFSIAIMAFIAMRKASRPSSRAPWILSTLFGALHGSGFASALLESGALSGSIFKTLLGFNLGVEVGQLVLVLLFLAPLSIASRNERRREILVVVLSGAVLAISLFWTAERIAESSLGT